MYYEEKIIDGVLHYRNLPDAEWKEMSKEKLTQKVRQEQKAKAEESQKYIQLRDAIKDWIPTKILTAIEE